MRPINRQRVGSQGVVLPKLTAEMVPGKKPVLTVQKVQEFNGREGPFLSIIFGEFPENSYNSNATQEDALLALVDGGKLPNDFDQWPGRRIPFFKKENTYSEGGVTTRAIKLYAVDAEDYDAALAEWDKGSGGIVPAGGAGAGRKTARTSAR